MNIPAAPAFPEPGGAHLSKKILAALGMAIVIVAALWAGPCSDARHRGPPADISAPEARLGSAEPAPRTRARAADVPEVAPSADAEGRPVDIVVEVTVRVLTAADAPVEGALVEAFRAQRGTEIQNADMRRGTLLIFDTPRAERGVPTGADGVATFRLAASQGWAFAASKEGFARATTHTPGFGPGIDLSHSRGRETITLRLGDACVLTGRVRDENGRPVAGAVVAVTPGIFFEYGSVRANWATTDADGRYAVHALAPGAARVHAARDGQAAVHSEVRLPYTSDFDLVLRTPGHLVGRVLDAADGAPIGGAIVRASTMGFGGIVETTSADDGNYRLAWCMDQPVGHLVAERADFATAPMDIPAPPGAVRGNTVPHVAGDKRRVLSVDVPAGADIRQDVLMVRAGRIHGVVRGDSGPLAGAQITATIGREQDGVWVAPAVSGAGGRYELTSVPGGVVVLHAALEGWYAAAHPLGRWAAALRADAKPSPWRIEIPPGGDLEHDIVMTRGVAVEGIVVTEDGSPVGGAPVVGATVRAIQSDIGWLRAQTTSAADGTFRLDGVAPDRRAFVWAIADGLCMGDDAVEVDPTTKTRVTLRMIPPVRITGTVTDADGALPPAGTTVTVSIEVARSERGGLGVPDFAPSAAVGADGRFVIDVRAPRKAKLNVLATAPGRGHAAGGGFTVDEARGGRSVDIRLPAAETVRGRVVVRGSSIPVPDATIRSPWAAGPAVARTGPDGTFVIEGRDPGVPAGQGRHVFVTADGFALGRAAAPAGGGDVLVELDPVLEISGTVRFPDGAAAAGVAVSAERQGAIEGSWYEFGEAGIGPFRADTVTDARGAFRLRGLRAGRYVALARPPADGSVRVRPGRSAAVDAGARDVVVIVERRADAESAGDHDALSDGDLGRDAIWRLMQKEPERAAAAWEALLARPLAADARAEALDLYASGPLRALGRRDEAMRALEEAVRLATAGSPRLANAQLDLATVLVEAARFADAIPVARDAAASSAGKDPLVNALARFRGAQARARLGETDAAREEFRRLRDEAGDRKDGGWPSVRAMAEAELRR